MALTEVFSAFPALAFGLYALLTAGALALLAMGARWFAVRGTAGKTYALLSRVYTVVQAVVLHVEADLRPTIAKTLSDGRLTPEEAKLIKDQALALVKVALVAQVEELERTMKLGGGALDVFLSGLIEQAHSALAPSSPRAGAALAASATRPPAVAPAVPRSPSLPAPTK